MADNQAERVSVWQEEMSTSGTIAMLSYPHIRSLKIENFKGIASLELPLDESLTLLAGVNGVGKTSAIEALLGMVTRVYCDLPKEGIGATFQPSGDLVRYGEREARTKSELVLEDGVETVIEVIVPVGGLWNPSLWGPEYRFSSIPLVVYYDQNRIGGLQSGGYRLLSETNRKAAIDTTPHALSDFKTWYFEKEGDEAREAIERNDLGYMDPEVRAVREVLKSIAGNLVELRSRKPAGSMDRMLFFQKEGGRDIPFDLLSGGEKAYFLLAVDLARRLLL